MATDPFDVTVMYGDLSDEDPAPPTPQFTADDVEAVGRMKEALASLDGLRVSYLERHADLLPRLVEDPPSFVLNFCDTGYRNDPTHELHVPAALELADVPYSGSGPTCLGLCYDKAAVRAIAAARDVPVPAEQFIGPEVEAPPLPDRYPALIKPCTGDGSVGITAESVVETAAEAEGYIAHLRDTFPDRALLIQPFLSGAEYTIGLVGNPDTGYDVLPPLVVDYDNLNPDLPPILSYESKADSSSDYWNQIGYREAEMTSTLRDELVGYATTLARRLHCRDYVRVDFRCDADGSPYLLEVNPNPAWCWDGKMNIMAGFRGDSYADFLRQIIEAARRRV